MINTQTMNRNLYTVWSFHEAPFSVQIQAPKKCTWVVKVNPYFEEEPVYLPIGWDLEKRHVGLSTYFFITDPQNSLFPRLTPGLIGRNRLPDS